MLHDATQTFQLLVLSSYQSSYSLIACGNSLGNCVEYYYVEVQCDLIAPCRDQIGLKGSLTPFFFQSMWNLATMCSENALSLYSEGIRFEYQQEHQLS